MKDTSKPSMVRRGRWSGTKKGRSEHNQSQNKREHNQGRENNEGPGARLDPTPTANANPTSIQSSQATLRRRVLTFRRTLFGHVIEIWKWTCKHIVKTAWKWIRNHKYITIGGVVAVLGVLANISEIVPFFTGVRDLPTLFSVPTATVSNISTSESYETLLEDATIHEGEALIIPDSPMSILLTKIYGGPNASLDIFNEKGNLVTSYLGAVEPAHTFKYGGREYILQVTRVTTITVGLSIIRK